MFVGSKVSGTTSERIVMVPPFLAPSISLAGPFAPGSVAFSWASLAIVPPPPGPLLSEGLPHAASASVAVATTAMARFHCIRCFSFSAAGAIAGLPASLGVEGVADRVSEERQREHQRGDRHHGQPQVERIGLEVVRRGRDRLSPGGTRLDQPDAEEREPGL